MSTIEQNDEAQEIVDLLHRQGHQNAARLANIIAKLRSDLDLANDECREKQEIIEVFLGGEKAADAAIDKLRAELAAMTERAERAEAIIDNLVAGAQP